MTHNRHTLNTYVDVGERKGGGGFSEKQLGAHLVKDEGAGRGGGEEEDGRRKIRVGEGRRKTGFYRPCQQHRVIVQRKNSEREEEERDEEEEERSIQRSSCWLDFNVL